MRNNAVCWVIGLLLTQATTAQADIYGADAAMEKKDLARAFELYREIAELGHPRAQAKLAVMYTNGEGVRRDQVLGHAWALLATENGGGIGPAPLMGEVPKILAQAGPLSDVDRARISQVHAQFGTDALRLRLIPIEQPPRTDVPLSSNVACLMKSVADPDRYYPEDAKRTGTWGTVMVEAVVSASGFAHRANVWYSFPQLTFDEAGRTVALRSQYKPGPGAAPGTPCTVRFLVTFRTGTGNMTKSATTAMLAKVKREADRGDPMAQITYGLIIATRSELNTENDKPVRWFLKAAQAGIPAAQYLVGRHALAGSVFEADEVKGLTWLGMAAKAGSVDAQLALANYLLRSGHDAAIRMKGFDWMMRAANAGNREAQLYLSALLVAGPDPARRDPRLALKLLDKVRHSFENDPAYFEIRAAAHALSGEFKQARKLQEQAVRAATRLNWDTTPQGERLAAYAQGRTWDGELIDF
jgi:TPR repeat protein